MSKVIKQMEMDALRGDLQEVRDLVVVSFTKVSSQADHQLRSSMRKKNIRIKVVKNSLMRRVFHEAGVRIGDDSPYWAGPTALIWGANSIAELSRTLDSELKSPKNAPLYKDRLTVKGAIVEGQPISFDLALKMPTREEAIAQIVGMILGPGSAIAGCLTGPAAQIASQIQTLSEKEENAEATAEPAPAAG